MLITPIAVTECIDYGTRHLTPFTAVPWPDDGPQEGWLLTTDEWVAVLRPADDEWVAFIRDEEGDAWYTIQEFQALWLEAENG